MEDTVLVADPDADRRERTVTTLETRLSGPAVGVGSIQEALAVFDEHPVEWVVAETEFPDGTGLDLVTAVRDRSPDTACVLFTAEDPDEIDTGSADGEAVEYLPRDRSAAADRLVELFDAVESLRAQTSYPFPDDEDERLAIVERLGPDAGPVATLLDRITTLVADRLGVPTASVNIIGEHTQEFLACHGADWSSTDREDSICTFTIAGDRRVMTVPDVQEDPRFATVDALDGLGIRAYMGATLAVDGHPLGTLCVYDDQPREFSNSERETLEQFADVAAGIIELYCDLQRAGGTAGDGR